MTQSVSNSRAPHPSMFGMPAVAVRASSQDSKTATPGSQSAADWAALAWRGGLGTGKAWSIPTLVANTLPGPVRWVPLCVSAGLHALAIGADQDKGPPRSVGEEFAHRNIRYVFFPATFLLHGLSARRAAGGERSFIGACEALWQKVAGKIPHATMGSGAVRAMCQVSSGAAGIALSQLTPFPPSQACASACGSAGESEAADWVAVAAGALAFLPSVAAQSPMGAAFLKGKLSPPAQLIWQAFLVPLNCAVSDAAQLAVKRSRRGSASDAAATAFPVQAIRRGSVGDAAGNPFA